MSVPLLPAFASSPPARGGETRVQERESIPPNWRAALDKLGPDGIGEILAGERILIPDKPNGNGNVLTLPHSTPYPKGKIKPFKKLSIRQRRILALHMRGWTNEEVARAMDLPIESIQATLKNHTTQAVLADLLADSDDELRALAPFVVDRLRTSLTKPTDQRVGLQAVDLYMKTMHRYKEAPEKAHTAEDVIQEILKIRTEGASEITIARQGVKRDDS